ncbi:hypothetical protein TNCT_69721 [Trichonephila clavata]|uniref:Uncharacterized protein n=1 Tax=Trichonephila clavata TaxID=2740835 RepID=A0A8X6IP12_TRICU|nr:hypothetical protein TNCT_69721 [Trichonephila clavata]
MLTQARTSVCGCQWYFAQVVRFIQVRFRKALSACRERKKRILVLMEVEKPVSFSLLSRLLKKSHLRLDFRSGATDRKVPPCSLTHLQLPARGLRS